MLVFLRKASQTLFAKILLLLLVLSFGVWGVSASLFSNTSDTVVAVGDQSVSSADFAFAYQRQVTDMSNRFGMQLTTEQARAFGIESQVFSQLAAGAALDQLAADMNLGLSQDRLAQLIADDPAFKNSGGNFDRALFSSRLRNAGLREDDYIEERSKVAIRSQIVDATADGFVAPKVLIDAIKAYRYENRDINYILLTNANIELIKAPDDATLAAWFETTKSGYRAPEYRSFNYVKLEPSDIADTASITDEQIREDYERRKASYEIAGTRTIEQLSFENREMAEAALEELQKGTSFDQLVTDQGKTAGDVLLGDFTRDRLPDPTLAEAAFAVTAEGGTTGVVDGAFGPVILRVTNIKEGRTQSLEEVKEEIREALAEQAAIADLTAVHDQFEDLRAGGSTLKEAADQLQLQTVTVTDIDRRGLDSRETEVAGIPERDKLLADVFSTEIGVEALPVTMGSNGFIWFDVTDIKAERERELAEVREKAIADWTAEQQRIALGAKAESLRQRIADGGNLEEVAAELALAVESKAGITRRTEDAVLGATAITAAFSGPQGTVATASGADPSTQILLTVTAVRDQPTGGVPLNEDEQIAQVANSAGDDILDQMVGQLQSEYGVTINQALAQQAIVR
ncbi:peptidylprolyl isomerase [Agrobacterium sp. RAC06]|uniref:peptidylprolyl isomerase n=1 Tax=Agrobacterium sp. RAC06 TaxID=1842536 RepID=UPI00083D5949|nr:peptidylprolyl isomerase [Agrobacterium sp. RAC06]AOG11966.1 PPIC-type PPIASE domain protein [Agrobacterium sp. RAC06]MDM8015285.1 SurA N-terminal domain-containing protein [Rhizobium sp.]